MQVKKIYGALNLEFEGRKFVNFAIMDRKCDSCMDGKCKHCDEAGKPWNEYYQLMKYSLKYDTDETMYEKDPTKAIRELVKLLQGYLDEKEDTIECTEK